MLKSNGRDTLPAPTCPTPFMCDGLEQVITDVGILREQMTRMEANQELTLHEMKRIGQILGLLLPRN